MKELRRRNTRLKQCIVLMVALSSCLLQAFAASYGTQDCLMENCLPTQSGYLSGYNFDPAVVGSPSFGQLWNTFVGNDIFLAQPITYTPSGGSQVVIAMSESNNIYVLDAVTGAIKTQRYVGAPFTATDAQCADISPTIGITSTPVIDASSGTLYFWSKTYLDPTGNTTGLNNGRYLFYGVDAITLQDKFTPYSPQGLQAANNMNQYFEGGKQLQRVGLQLINGVVYSAFGGHCDNFNYTGWIMGNDAQTGGNVNSFSTQSGPHAKYGSGVWQSGGALAWDGYNIYFVTGNGFGEELSVPRLGSSPPGTLAMAVTRLSVDPNSHNLTATDFFVPSDYTSIDAADQDFGSSGVCLLPTGFAQGSVRRLIIANGKNSKAYIMNADNLGGFKTGSGGGDGNLQTIPLGGQSFATAGGYPLEGGYIYLSAVNSPTLAFKLGADSNGNPLFTQVGQTTDVSPNIRGTGHSTITSNNGAEGTGLLWVTDTQNGNLRVYPAVPPSSGSWNHIFVATLPRGGIKYGRVTPGSGRMYVTGTGGSITAYGSPVNQPFNCTSGLDLGTVVLGNTSSVRISCQPLITTKITALTVSNSTLAFVGAPSLPSPQYMATSPPVTFNVTWTPNWAGTYVFAVTLNTTNAQTGYVTSLPISVTGKAVSANSLLSQTPSNLAFGGLTPGSNLTVGGANKTISISNLGLKPLKVVTWDFDEFYNLQDDADDGDDSNNNGDADTDGTLDKKTTTGNFTLYGMPDSVPPQSSVTLIINYNPTVFGDYTGNLTILTDGGKAITIMTGTAAAAGEFHLMTEQYDGSYLIDTNYMDFGNVLSGSKLTLDLIVNNTGGSALQLTKSKPPVGAVLRAANGVTDLTEGQYISPNSSADAPIIVSPLLSQVNVAGYNLSDQWVLNANGDNPGVRFVQMSARIVSRQVGPLLSVSSTGDVNGTARYQYLGCYPENSPTRSFSIAANVNSSTMENGACTMAAANSNGVGNFVASEYGQECWFRTQTPITSVVDDQNCAMPCAGDKTQSCGAAGYMSVFYDTLAYNKTSGQFLPGAFTGTVEVPYTGNWTSLSCVTEAKTGRALNGAAYTNGSSMTVESCTSFCQGKMYSYAGIEYASECYCGNSLGSGVTFNATGCTMACSGSRFELCGGGSRLNLYMYNQTYSTTSSSSASASSTATGTTTTAPASSPTTSSTPYVYPANYKGCYKEPSNGRALTYAASVSNNTVEACQSACTAANYTVAGAEYGSECWCANAFSTGTTTAPDSDCATACPGNSTEFCGAGNRLSVYSLLANITTLPPPSIPATVGNYSSIGCYSEATNGRALNGLTPNLGKKNSLENCASACSGYTYFGAEYGSECYCGNTIASTAQNKSLSDCSMVCSGNTSEYCGAGNRLSMYQLIVAPPASSSSSSSMSTSSSSSSSTTPIPMTTTTSSSSTSSTSSTTSSTLTSSSTSSTVSSTSSTPSSTSTSSSTSTTPTFTSTTITSTSTSTSTSTTPTPTSSSTLSSSTITTSSSTSSSSTTTSSSSSSSTAVPSSTALPTGFTALAGCYYDGTSKTLATKAYSNSSNTPSFCAKQCRQLGYRYAGVEYGNECYCDNFILNSGASQGKSAMSDCSSTCAGDKTQTCGGSNRLQIYQDTQWKQSVYTIQMAGKWNFTDCLLDNPPPRTLNVSFTGGNSMTVESCLSNCAAKNMAYCGVEYGTQCWGALLSPNFTTKAAPNVGSPDSLARGCNTACKGNISEACGGPSHIAVYTFNPNATSISPSTRQTISP